MAGSKRPQSGAKSGSSRQGKNGHKSNSGKALEEIDGDKPEKAPIRINSGGNRHSATPAMMAKGAE